MRLNALAAATVQVGPGAGGLRRKRVIEHAAHALSETDAWPRLIAERVSSGGSVLLYCGSQTALLATGHAPRGNHRDPNHCGATLAHLYTH